MCISQVVIYGEEIESLSDFWLDGDTESFKGSGTACEAKIYSEIVFNTDGSNINHTCS